jgi:hypothetical protein
MIPTARAIEIAGPLREANGVASPVRCGRGA